MKTVEFDAFAKPFKEEPRGSYRFRVEDLDKVTVWDGVADHFTSCHSLTAADRRRLLKLAKEVDLKERLEEWAARAPADLVADETDFMCPSCDDVNLVKTREGVGEPFHHECPQCGCQEPYRSVKC